MAIEPWPTHGLLTFMAAVSYEGNTHECFHSLCQTAFHCVRGDKQQSQNSSMLSFLLSQMIFCTSEKHLSTKQWMAILQVEKTLWDEACSAPCAFLSMTQKALSLCAGNGEFLFTVSLSVQCNDVHLRTDQVNMALMGFNGVTTSRFL